jgi:hypothetical protein
MLGSPRHRIALAVLVSFGVVLWEHVIHAVVLGEVASLAEHASHVLRDGMLALPLGLAVVWASARLAARWRGRTGARMPLPVLASLASVLYTLVTVPSVVVHHLMEGNAPGQIGTHVHAAAGGGLETSHTAAGMLLHGLRDATIAEIVALPLALVGLALLARSASGPRRAPMPRRVRLAFLTSVATAVAMLSPFGTVAAQAQTALALPAPFNPCTQTGVNTRHYDVSAINIDITYNRSGDHDPFGFMYVPDARLSAVRQAEAAHENAVSLGLRQDVIQPLVLRGRLGECVEVTLTNRLTDVPHGGPGIPPQPFVTSPRQTPEIVQSGPVPSVSINPEGVTYTVAGQDAGVGVNPTSNLAPPPPPGQQPTSANQRTYRFYLDPAIGEGAKPFHSGGEARQLTAHGLFGVIDVAPTGARWFDPITGVEKTNDATWSNWEAMIQPTSGATFREFTIIYHEVGDENFDLRQRASSQIVNGTFNNADGKTIGVPMIDFQFSGAYRVSGKALNYRSESFWRRLQFAGFQNLANEGNDKSQGYGSYMFGDPATPMPRSYLGEPTKIRLVNPGSEQLHVHHLHGGGDRWRANPRADVTDFDDGLQKVPVQNAKSIRLDSQTIGPDESYSNEIEGGAGGVQQVAADFLYHCHIAQHYIGGMFSLWRVFDTRRPDLAVLPGRAAPPTAVNSADLLGRTINAPQGSRTVVLGSKLTNPNTQIALEDLVESQLPPQGVRANSQDATVWDWLKNGNNVNKPIYQGEPEDSPHTTTGASLGWVDFIPDPNVPAGTRPDIMFNPNTGRYTWPMLRPHLGKRPPFSTNGHTGAPWLGENVSAGRPDGLCPTAAPLRTYNITAITLPIRTVKTDFPNPTQVIKHNSVSTIANVDDGVDAHGEVFVLSENKDAVLAGQKPAEPLAIRSNVGDCVALTLTSELGSVQSKVNMHTHFVQFDPQASDGVITGFSYEQSVKPLNDNRTLDLPAAATGTFDDDDNVYAAGVSTVRMHSVNGFAVGDTVVVGASRDNAEVRSITAVDTTALTLTFDAALTQQHKAEETVSKTFLQAAVPVGATTVNVGDVSPFFGHSNIYIAIGQARNNIEIRRITAVSGGTLTLDRPLSQAHVVGEAVGTEFVQYRWYSDVDSGTVFWHDHVDGIKSWGHGLFAAHIIEPAGSTYHDPQTGAQVRSGAIVDIHTSGSVGVDETGSFREYMIWLHNGNQGMPVDRALFAIGQECEEGTINLRSEPLAVRLLRSQADVDTATAEPGGPQCDNVAGTGNGAIPIDLDDPLVLNTGTPLDRDISSSVGTTDPYIFSSVKYGDPFTPTLRAYTGDPVVIRTIGLVERVGALRVQGHRFRRERFNTQGELMDAATTGISERFDYVLDGGAGGPKHNAGDFIYYSTRNFELEQGGWGIMRVHDRLMPDLQPLPGHTPASGTGGFPRLTFTGQDPPAVGSSPEATSPNPNPCPGTAPVRSYDVSVFNKPLPARELLPGNRAVDTDVLGQANDPNGIMYALSTDRPAIQAGTKEPEPLVIRANVGDCVRITLHDDIAAGTTRYGGTRAALDLAKLLSDPQSTGAPVGFNPDATVAAGGLTQTYSFFADKELGTSIFKNLASVPSTLHGAYGALIVEPAGSMYRSNVDNSPIQSGLAAIIRPSRAAAFREFVLLSSTTDDQHDRSVVEYEDDVEGWSVLNGHNTPMNQRLVANPDHSLGFATLATANHGDPPSSLLARAYVGDAVRLRVAVPASQQFHVFSVDGHAFPWEPALTGSQILTARALGPDETQEASLVSGAGGFGRQPGDYLIKDGRAAFARAGMWAILRVHSQSQSDVAKL